MKRKKIPEECHLEFRECAGRKISTVGKYRKVEIPRPAEAGLGMTLFVCPGRQHGRHGSR